MPRGGKRPGAGRPKGSRNKSTLLKEEILPKLEAADQELPLYGLSRRIADESLDPRYRDMLRIAVLPYLHPRVLATAGRGFLAGRHLGDGETAVQLLELARARDRAGIEATRVKADFVAG